MRAALIHEWNTPPLISDVAEPHRLPGETLVQIDAAAVGHLDITVATGEFTLQPPLPYVPGVEGSGTVLESDTFEPGTQVILRDGTIGVDRNGTWRERAAVPDAALTPLRIRVNPSVAATFFVPTATAYIALHDLGSLKNGQTVIISGATGAVGSMAVQLALQAGANVIALVSRSSRLAQLPDGVRGITADDAAASALLAAERPADLLLDTIGGSDLSQRIKWVRTGGRAICVGYTAGAKFTIDLPNWLLTDVSIVPLSLISKQARAKEVIAQLIPKIADETIRVDFTEFPFEQTADALHLLMSREIRGRAVIRF
ncbi:quinone oxidoreductase family protein [Pseudarthrobacter sp. TAF60_1]|uniref:quinone oxidoreductase family protein n=1 Tax=Pseudarthrobacter sp. TAF60_1 TaxID=3233071 RepID=UPI003F9A0EA1